jgi:hypothetical protein
VDSLREVQITKMFVSNSICGYRESKKSDKYIVELATRAQDPDIRALAVDVLNEYHKEVQAAQDDPENAKLIKLLRKERAEKEKERREIEDDAKRGATTVPETSAALDLDNIIDAKRTRRRPERFEDVQWDDNGKCLGVLSETDRRALEEQTFGGDNDGDEDDDDDNGKDFSEARRPRKYDPWIDVESDPEDESEFEGSTTVDSDLEEEVRERPLTEKQRAKIDARSARESKPKMDDAARQLAIKLLDEYDRVYTDDDLDEDVHLAKKVGLPFDEVPNVHIKVCDKKRFSKHSSQACLV